jgi:YidC/Oxa1 family membrane protein insertase
MSGIFNEIIYKPLLNFAVFLYNLVPGNDFGLAIIILTIVVRLILMPLSLKALRSQKALNSLSAKVNEIKEKFKDNKTAQSEAIMKLYKDEGVNPIAGCLPILIQLPILLALYKVFSSGLNSQNLDLLYSFISKPGVLNNLSLGFLNITQRNIPLVLLAGGLQFLQGWQQKRFNKDANTQNKEMGAIANQMLYFLPFFIIIIGWKMPAGVILFWVVTTAFSIFEQYYIKSRS